jgi:hypothetical protein
MALRHIDHLHVAVEHLFVSIHAALHQRCDSGLQVRCHSLIHWFQSTQCLNGTATHGSASATRRNRVRFNPRSSQKALRQRIKFTQPKSPCQFQSTQALTSTATCSLPANDPRTCGYFDPRGTLPRIPPTLRQLADLHALWRCSHRHLVIGKATRYVRPLLNFHQIKKLVRRHVS